MVRAAELRGGKFAFIWAVIISIIIMSMNVGNANASGDVVSRSLHGTILDEAGLPIEGASVRIGVYNSSQGFRQVASVVTDDEGHYEALYEKTLGDAVSAILDVQGQVVVYEVPGDTLDFRMTQERATITGTIAHPDEYATPVQGYPVSISVNLGRGGGRIEVGSLLTDRDGSYRFSIIPGQFQSIRGENRFSVVLNGNMEEVVELRQGDQRVMDCVVYDAPPASYYNGMLQVDVIHADTNEPIEHASVELAGTDEVLFQAGHYFFSNVLRGGHYTVAASAEGYAAAEYPVTINGGVALVTVKLAPAISNSPPVVTATAERAPDRNGWYNRDVLVSFQATDEKDGELPVDPPVRVTTEGANQSIVGSATDSAGLTGTGSLLVSLDKTAPVTAVDAAGDAGGGNWYRSDVRVTLTASDLLSGSEKTMYSLDRGRTWLSYDGPITFTSEGEHRLQYRSTDVAGNTEDVKQLVVKIDKTKPVLALLLNPPLLNAAGEGMVPVKAVTFGYDGASGIASIVLTSITVYENGGALPSGDDIHHADFGTFDTAFELRAKQPAAGLTRQYKVTYTATDLAGNVTTASSAAVVLKRWTWADFGNGISS